MGTLLGLLYWAAWLFLIISIAIFLAFLLLRKRFALLPSVVALVSVAVIVLVPRFGPGLMEAQDQSVHRRVQTNSARILMLKYKEALHSFYLAHGFFPSTTQGLAALVSKPTVDPIPEAYPPGGYLKSLVNDPWGNPIRYTCDDRKAFVLRSNGPDGLADSSDDVASD